MYRQILFILYKALHGIVVVPAVFPTYADGYEDDKSILLSASPTAFFHQLNLSSLSLRQWKSHIGKRRRNGGGGGDRNFVSPAAVEVQSANGRTDRQTDGASHNPRIISWTQISHVQRSKHGFREGDTLVLSDPYSTCLSVRSVNGEWLQILKENKDGQKRQRASTYYNLKMCYGNSFIQLENNSSRMITEVKQCWARLVLGWETVRLFSEYWCLPLKLARLD